MSDTKHTSAADGASGDAAGLLLALTCPFFHAAVCALRIPPPVAESFFAAVLALLGRYDLPSERADACLLSAWRLHRAGGGSLNDVLATAQANLDQAAKS